MSDGELDDLMVHVAITRLHGAYADIVTRRAWDELDGLFAPDAPVTIDTGRGEPIVLAGGAAVGQFVAAAVERFEFFEFVPLSCVTARDGDEATARLYIQEVRQERGGFRSDAFGRYDDRYVRVDGRWCFASRRYRSLARGADRLEVIEPPAT